MSAEAVAGAELHVASGCMAARRWGTPGGALTICVPGLSQDDRSFAVIGSRLARPDRQVVALALRGRGRSDATPPGTYGWPAHARDVVDCAAQLGYDRFDYIGWSFGGLVGLQLARDFPGAMRRAVLVDVVGVPDASSLAPITAGLERLGTTYPTEASYVDAVLASGAMDTAREVWREYLSGDLEPCPGGFRPRTDQAAVVEDARYGAGQDPYSFWPALTMPVLLVRAAEPILPGLGFIVTESDRDRFVREVPGARVAEIPANHYCVGMQTVAADAIGAFLDSPV